VLWVNRGELFENGRRADALVSDDPRRVVAVRVADCVPVLLAAPDGGGATDASTSVDVDGRVAIGALAGRGVKQRAEHVGAAAREARRERRVAVLRVEIDELEGALALDDVALAKLDARRDALASELAALPGADGVAAAIGPCIGFGAFEVGPEVIEAFVRRFGEAAPVRRRGDGSGHIDLREAVRRQLVAAGLSPDRIDTTDRCTFRDSQEFFSHRRDNGVTGRMAAMIGTGRSA
jgi:hypothetical protein